MTKQLKRGIALIAVLVLAMALVACDGAGAGGKTHAIVGKWEAEKDADFQGIGADKDAKLVYDFKADGTMQMTIDGKTIREYLEEVFANLSLPSEIEVSKPSVPETVIRYEVTDTKLTLLNANLALFEGEEGDGDDKIELDYKIEGDKLTLSDPKENETVTFKRVN